MTTKNRRTGFGALAAVAGLVLLAGHASAEMSVGVAPFERVSAEGQGVPDVSGRLAQRLGTKGVEKVVGPEDLGAPALADPEAADVSAWAQAAGVGAVVVGRTTRIGRSLSIDARILDAATGAALGAPVVEEIAQPADFGNALEGLADQVLARLKESGPVAAARPEAAAAPAAASAPAKRSGAGSDGPISIKADELEALEGGSQRRFVFRGNVHAIQDDLVLDSDKLVAFYPSGGSQPGKLVATGNVVMVQTGRTAYCQKATFYRTDQRMVCVGEGARLVQGCDIVRGKEITFHLDTEVLHVVGAADVKLRPDDPSCVAGN